MRRHVPAAIAIAVATLMGAGARSARAESTALTSMAIVADGSWQVTQSPNGATSQPLLSSTNGGSNHWQVNASRVGTDGIEGSVDISSGDGPVLAGGKVSGHIHNGRVWGDITDAAGNLVATFEGVIGRDGIEGTFTGRSDEQGSWSWSR